MSEVSTKPDVPTDAAATAPPPAASALRTATRSIRLHSTLSRSAAGATFAMGTVVLIGWVFDIALFKTLLHPARIAMNPATAVGFLLAAAALWLLLEDPVTFKRRRAAQG